MTQVAPKIRILFVDPDKICREIQRRLSSQGYVVDTAGFVEARGLIEADPPSMLVIFSSLNEEMETLLGGVRDLRTKDVFVPTIVLLEQGDVATRVKLLKGGADECLDARRLDDKELEAKLEALLRIKGIQDRMHESRRQLQNLSTLDALTGTLNKQQFEKRLYEEVKRAQRYADHLSLLLLNLDKFSKVNEDYGERTGSELLKAFARLLTGSVRDIDVTGRLAADSFVLLLPQTHLCGALTVAERIRTSIKNNPFRVKGVWISLTVSIGLSFFPSREVESKDDLLRMAGEALYQARRQGSGKIGLFQGAHYLYHEVD